LAVCVAIIAVALVFSPPQARADGDPASDVLAFQTLFLPQDASVPASQQAELGALIQSAQRSGYEIRVALIASPTDLGSITGLWRQPQNYAEFLGQELSLVYRGPLLVIMPDGFGLYNTGHTPAAKRPVLAAVAISPGAGGLVTTAMTAIRRLAAASGHTLTVSGATVRPPAGSTDAAAWVVFVIGGALAVSAWAASLRARPMQLHRKSRPSV